ncbi:MAG: hypothetical protein ACLSUW_05155 [Akkermansia sp.]
MDVTLGKAEDAVLHTMEHGITRAGTLTLFQADSRMKGRPICAMTHP